MSLSAEKLSEQLTLQLVDAIVKGNSQEVGRIFKSTPINVQNLPPLPCHGVYQPLFASLVKPAFQHQYNSISTSALMYAAYSKNVELVKLLLNEGALINWDRYEKYPVHLGVSEKPTNSVNFIQHCIPDDIQKIIKEEADRKAQFFEALEKGMSEALAPFIKSGINPNWRREEDGLSVLEVASLKEDVTMLHILLEAGLKITGNILEYTIRHKKPSALSILLKHSKEIKEISACLLSTAASGVDNEEIVRLLLQGKANPTLADQSGKTALHYAADKGSLKTVSLLLPNVVDINQVTVVSPYEGWTALHFAANNGHEAVVELLIQSKAQTTVQTKKGETPAYLAVRNGHGKVLNIFTQGNSPFVLFQQIVQGTQFTLQAKIKRLESELHRQKRELEAEKVAHGRDILMLMAANPETLHRVIQSGDLETIQRVLESMPDIMPVVASVPASPVRQRHASPSGQKHSSPSGKYSSPPQSPLPSPANPERKSWADAIHEREQASVLRLIKPKIPFDLRALSFIHVIDKIRGLQENLRRHGAIVTLEQLEKDVEEYLVKPQSLEVQRYLKQLYSDINFIMSHWRAGTLQNSVAIEALNQKALKQLIETFWSNVGDERSGGTAEVCDNDALTARIKKGLTREKRVDFRAWLNSQLEPSINTLFENFLAEHVWQSASAIKDEGTPFSAILQVIQEQVIFNCLQEHAIGNFDLEIIKALKFLAQRNFTPQKTEPLFALSKLFWAEVRVIMLKMTSQDKSPTQDEINEEALIALLKKWRENKLSSEELYGIRTILKQMSKESLLKGEFHTTVLQRVSLELVRFFKRAHTLHSSLLEDSQTPGSAGLGLQSPKSDKEGKNAFEERERKERKDGCDEQELLMDERTFTDLFARFNDIIDRGSATVYQRHRICENILAAWKGEQLTSDEQQYLSKIILKDWTDRLDRLGCGFDGMARLAYLNQEFERLRARREGELALDGSLLMISSLSLSRSAAAAAQVPDSTLPNQSIGTLIAEATEDMATTSLGQGLSTSLKGLSNSGGNADKKG